MAINTTFKSAAWTGAGAALGVVIALMLLGLVFGRKVG